MSSTLAEIMLRQKSSLVSGLSLVVICFLTITGVVSCTTETPSLPLSPTPAAFQIADLSINPIKVESEGVVTISAEVTNTGDTEGIYTAELKINGVIEAIQEITLAGGESRLLSFSVSRDTLGTYMVTWDELAGEFIVVKQTMYTVTWTDSVIKQLLVGPMSGVEIHFFTDNRVQLSYLFFNYTFDCGVIDGKLYLGGVPDWIPDFLDSVIGSYTSYDDGKLFLTALPSWFDPAEKIAPGVTQLPAIESIETKLGEAIITYRWP